MIIKNYKSINIVFILLLLLFINYIQSQSIKDISLFKNYNIYADETGYCKYEFDFYVEGSDQFNPATSSNGKLILLNQGTTKNVYKLYLNVSSTIPITNTITINSVIISYPTVQCNGLPSTLNYELLSNIPNKVSNDEFNLNLVINNVNKIIPASSMIKTYCPDYYICSTYQVGSSDYFITSIKFSNNGYSIQNVDFNINYEFNNKNTTYSIKSPFSNIILNSNNGNGLNLNSYYEINNNLKSISSFINLDGQVNTNGIVDNVFIKFSNDQIKLLTPVLGSGSINNSNIGIQLFTSNNMDSSITSNNVQVLYFLNGQLTIAAQQNSQSSFNRTFSKLSSSELDGMFWELVSDNVQIVSITSNGSNYYETSLNDNGFIQFPLGFASQSSSSVPKPSTATFSREISINMDSHINNIKNFNFEDKTISILCQRVLPIPNDTNPPSIVSMQLRSVGILSILNLQVIDDLSGFNYLELSNGIKVDSRFLVEGSLLNGKLEFIFNLLDMDYQDQLRVNKICDFSLNCVTYSSNGIKYNVYNEYTGSTFPSLGTSNVALNNITSFSFKQNSIDTTNQNVFTSVNFNFSNVNPQTDYPPYLELFNDGKSNLDYRFNQIIDKIIFQAYWNYDINMYQIDFTIRKNQFTTNDFIYWLVYQGERFSNTVLQSKFNSSAKLSITSTYADTLGPIVTSITPLQSKYQFEITQDTPVKVGWKLNIKDQYNGFKSGFVQLVSQETGKIYNITLTPSIIGLLDNELEVSVNFTGNCVSQHLSIKQIYLQDTGDYSTYEILDSVDHSSNSFSPLINIKDVPTIYVECFKIDESVLPSLVSLTLSKSELDVGSEDRNVKVIFEVYDNSGIDTSQVPICYLANTAFDYYPTSAQVIKSNLTNTQFLCDIEIPIGYGSQGYLLLSIYGIFDHSNLVGFSSRALQLKSFPYSIKVNQFTLSTPAIYSVGKFFSSDSLITIIGRSLDNSFIQIDYLQGFGFENITGQQQPIKGDNSDINSIIVSTINKIGFQFDIRIININTNQISNSYRVVPIISGLPIDSNNNNNNTGECINECGGNDHGTCTLNGCLCKLPYTGLDCQSKITHIQNYIQVNSTKPVIKLLNNNNDQLIKTIDIVLVREVDNNGKMIKEFNLDQWDILVNQSDGFKYTTTINNNNYKTRINVSTVWNNINNATTIQYQVDISAYSFSNDQSKLELFILNQLDKVSTYKGVVCSNYNASIESSNSNIINNKLIMDQDSLLNQINLIASIDNSQGTISTSIKNLNNNTININKGDSIKNYISILIPQYNVMVTVNSKYSIIKESSTITNDKSTICISKNIKEKGYSGQQKAATVLGVIGFVLISSLILWFFIIKPKRDAKR